VGGFVWGWEVFFWVCVVLVCFGVGGEEGLLVVGFVCVWGVWLAWECCFFVVCSFFGFVGVFGFGGLGFSV